MIDQLLHYRPHSWWGKSLCHTWSWLTWCVPGIRMTSSRCCPKHRKTVIAFIKILNSCLSKNEVRMFCVVISRFSFWSVHLAFCWIWKKKCYCFRWHSWHCYLFNSHQFTWSPFSVQGTTWCSEISKQRSSSLGAHSWVGLTYPRIIMTLKKADGVN